MDLNLSMQPKDTKSTHRGHVEDFSLILRVQVLYNSRNAEWSGKTKEVGNVAEGAAEEDGPAERTVHGPPDGWHLV